MDGYQPPLLSLQDMLNLSDDNDEEKDDDDSWSNNPFNIANFFEPISSIKVDNDANNASALPETWSGAQGSTGHSSSAYQSVYSAFDDIDFTPQPEHIVIQPDFPNTLDLAEEEGEGGLVDIKRELLTTAEEEEEANFKDEDGGSDGQNLSKEEFPDLDCFDEEMVTSELEQEKGSEVQEGVPVDVADIKAERILPDLADDNSTPVSSPQKDKRDAPQFTAGRKPIPETFKQSSQCRGTEPSRGPTLREVKVEDVTTEEMKTDREGKSRQHAINQLNSLISNLKRYSRQLQGFLENEGDMIMEHYNAKTLLRGMFPEINESANKTHPFYEAHAITTALTNHVKGRTFLSTLPRRTAYLWRGSDLLLLQKTILQSVIHQREFFLYCRYTDLLTQMGFDQEDMERLRRCITKEAEVGTMKIILNEHNFHSKMKASHKKPIVTTVVKDEKGSGIPRVYVFPNPEKLVEDKWTALIDIRRRTVLSNITEKDINWLYVLKGLADKNPKLSNMDEETCKRTYEHMLSFKYNNTPWHVGELQKMRDIRNAYPNSSWARVAELLCTNRSAFSCFVKYKTHCLRFVDNNEPLTTESLNLVRECFDKCSGNAFKVDFMLSRVLKKHHAWVKPYKLLMLAQRTINPRLRKGAFSTVEDALMLVVMEKYKNMLLDSEYSKKDPIGYAMPWRYSSIWKDRLKLLFTKFYKKMWTIEEDQRLWNLVEEYGANYKIIHRYFPYKDGKQCRSRHQQLVQIFQTGTLEDYHLMSNYRKEKGLDLTRLSKISQYLEMTIRSKLLGNVRYVRERDLEFLALRSKPTDYQLDCYLMSFPVRLIKAASKRLVDCMTQIKNKAVQLPEKGRNPEQLAFIDPDYIMRYDRRKFDPQCPVSIGSALHIMNAKLVPSEQIEDLTEFEAKIYTAYKFFTLRRTVKKKTPRTAIPTLDKLRKLVNISRILEQPVSVAVHKPGKPSVIVTIKSEIPDETEREREEQELLQELEAKRQGGRLKGSKRKKTTTKESRKRAAMIRWQNKRTAQEGAGCSSDIGSGDTGLKENVPSDTASDFANSPFWDTMSSPCTPATPGSIASTVLSTDNESSCGTGPSMRKVLMGMISDHAYILPMESPGDLSSLPLPQLFARMGGGGRGSRQAGLENQK